MQIIYDFNIITEFAFFKKRAFCPTIGTRGRFNFKKNIFRKMLVLLPEKNIPVRPVILFDFYEYASSRWELRNSYSLRGPYLIFCIMLFFL